MKSYDINIPSITVNSREELLAAIHKALDEDDDTRYSIDEVQAMLARSRKRHLRLETV